MSYHNVYNNIDYFCATINFNRFIKWIIQYSIGLYNKYCLHWIINYTSGLYNNIFPFMGKMLCPHDISKFVDLERSWASSLEWQDSTAVHLLQAIFFNIFIGV